MPPTSRLAFVGASRIRDSMLASAPMAVRFSISDETIMKNATAALSWYWPLAMAPITARATSAFMPALP